VTAGSPALERRARASEPSDSLWRHTDFTKLWVGQSVSILGSEMTKLALPLTAILTLDAAASQIGLLSAFQSASALALMLFAGVVVDRFRRRRLMIATDLMRALLIGIVPVLAFAGMLRMEVLYAVAFGVGSLTIMFDIAYSSYVPSIVTSRDLIAANSRLRASESLGTIFGASVGGMVVSVFRPAAALLADAVSFVVSALALASIRAPEPMPERPEGGGGNPARRFLREVGEGIGPNYRSPYLRPLTYNSAAANIVSQVILTLFILYATRDLDLSPVWIGVIYSAGGVGGVAGALACNYAVRKLGFGRAVVGAMVLFHFSLPLTPLIRGPESVVVPLLAVVWFLAVFGVVLSNIGQGTLRQVVIPDRLRGRVMAAHRLLAYGTLPLGALAAGYLGEAIGLYDTIVIASIVLPFTLYWILTSPIPKLKTVDDAVPVAEPERA
jgi:MFS family permease